MQLKIHPYTKEGGNRDGGNVVTLPRPDTFLQWEAPEVVEATEVAEVPNAVSVDEPTKVSEQIGEIRTVTCFNPAEVYYEAPSGRFYVGVGSGYRVYSKKTPVVNGITAHIREHGPDGGDAGQHAKDEVARVEIEQAVDWAGSLAGHQPGMVRLRSSTLLVTDGPKLIESEPGRFPVIDKILHEALGYGSPRRVFEAWLSVGLKAVMSGRHHPGQMMCLAGVVNSGKTLLAEITRVILGGRVANPHAAWAGDMVWNDDIVGSELLVIDDCESSTDIRSRRQLAARFKEAIYSSEVQLRKRYASGMSVRPVWRVMVCCNDNPEALQIIPPIDDDLADKVSLLRVTPIRPPVDTSSQAGRERFWSMIEAELPAFVDHLLLLEIPGELRDSRAGVVAFRDPELEEAVIQLSPERVLEELIMRMFGAGHLDAHPGESVIISASELQEKMTDRDSPVAGQARSLFQRWPAACGVYLGKLAKQRPELVRKATTVKGIQKWELIRPVREEEEGVDM